MNDNEQIAPEPGIVRSWEVAMKKEKPRAFHKWMVYGDTLMVSFTLPGEMSDDDWRPFVAAFRDRPITRYLGAAIGVVDITSVQRKVITEQLTAKKITTAAITDEAIIRGIATAVSWFGARIQAFSWKDLRKGLTYLEVPPALADKIFAELMQLKASNPVP